MASFRRFFIIVCCSFLCLVAFSDLQAARAYVIVDSQTGFVLDEQKSRDKLQVGSVTKIATAMVVLDWAEKHSGDLNQTATIPPEAFVGTGDNLIGFQPGDTITLRDLLYAALVQSDNIAAYTLANHVGNALRGIVPSSGSTTSIGVFVGQMNALAKALRMERTHFVNPHGIDTTERSLPYTTAADIVRLTRYAVAKAGFRFYVSQKERQIAFDRAGKKTGYMLRNTNELLGRDGVDGVKTGRTARAGDCLVLSAQRESKVDSGWWKNCSYSASADCRYARQQRSIWRRCPTSRARLATARPMGCRRSITGSKENPLIFYSPNDEAPYRRLDERW